MHVLSRTDILILTEVYAAGEMPLIASDSRALARAIRVAGKVEPLFIESIRAIPDQILDMVEANDVVVTMGAGSISSVPNCIVQSATNRL